MGLVFGLSLMVLIGGIAVAYGLVTELFYMFRHREQTKHIRIKAAFMIIALLLSAAVIVGCGVLMVAAIHY